MSLGRGRRGLGIVTTSLAVCVRPRFCDGVFPALHNAVYAGSLRFSAAAIMLCSLALNEVSGQAMMETREDIMIATKP